MAETGFFSELADKRFVPDVVLDFSNGNEKALIISDLHMGASKRDDLSENGLLLTGLLENYYYKQGWNLILNGDVEELQKYRLDCIEEKWKTLIQVFNLFAAQNRLYKITGNHDAELLLKKNYRFPLYNVIKINTGYMPAYIYHGHQSSNFYFRFNKLMGAAVRYVLKPLGIKNITSARSPYKRFNVEKAAYRFSLENNCISIIGHTHRPLFESLGRFDFIKFEIERLCRDYPASSGEERRRIETEVSALRKELGKLKRKERRDVLRQSLYGDELPVPCLFNSGSAISKKGLTAIELSGEDIALVYWFEEGRGRRFINRGGYEIEKQDGTPFCRAVLNHGRLDYISARIRLLGKM